MAVLTTPTEQYVLTDDNPYAILRLKKRFYMTAERVQKGGAELIRIWVYDAMTDTDMVAPSVVSETEASTIWQAWYQKLSA